MNDDAKYKRDSSSLQKRNSMFEILRIISMMLIIFSHFAYHGGFDFSSSGLCFNRLWNYLLILGGGVGVNVFVLISGYFLINNEKSIFNIKKLFKLCGEIFFYSITIYLAFILTQKVQFNFKDLLTNFFPVIFKKWWFATTYIVLYILHPFLNILLKNIKKGAYQTLLIILTIIWSIIPSFTAQSFAGSDLAWFVTLYAFAAYLKLYGLNPNKKAIHYLILFISFFAATYFSSILLTAMSDGYDFFKGHETFFFQQNKITSLAISLALFSLFACFRPRNNKFINILSSTTFGIYLIHDNYLIRDFIWIELFKNSSYQNSSYLFIYSIGVCLLVFLVCSIIDIVRIYSIEILYLKLIDCLSAPAKKVFLPLISFFKRLVFGKE